MNIIYNIYIYILYIYIIYIIYNIYIYIYIDVRSTAADPSFETAMCGKRYGRLRHVSSLVEQAKRSAMPRMQWPGWRNRACPAVYAVLRTGYRRIVASTAKIATFLFFL